MMREATFPRPMNSTEARELWEIIGRVMSDCARDVASRTGIPPYKLFNAVSREFVLHEVTAVFLRANERGGLPREAADEARTYLAHALTTFIERGRATVRPVDPPRP